MGKIVAVILAGGRGTRMGAKVSKQFIEIDGMPLIYYTIKAFEKSKCINEIVIVLPKDEIEYFKNNILRKYNLNVDSIVEGGKERRDSVYNALNSIKDCEVVLIHDGARPFISKEIIDDGIKYAKEFGAAAPGIMPKDTIKVKGLDDFSEYTLDRSSLVAVQTPQCFKFDLIVQCHKMIREKEISVTDDTMVVESFNNKVYLYNGDYKNIKVTTPEDLILCKEFVKTL